MTPRYLLAAVLSGLVTVLTPYTVLGQQRCAQPVAIFESVKNSVQLLQASTRAPQPATRRLTVCAGETIQVGSNSRAVILILASNTPLSLDQNSEFVITQAQSGTGSLVELLRGALLFISRVRQSVEIRTPFVNAAIEGTEFVVRVQADRTVITVFEGAVRATNPLGTVVVGAGQQAVAVQGQAPVIEIPIRPLDAVQWALHYEPLLPLDSFEQLLQVPEPQRGASFYLRRASLQLGAGQLEAARSDLDRVQQLEPTNGDAYALRAIIAVALNDNAMALESARTAIERRPRSASAHIALSYALQANLDLDAALRAATEAVAISPDSGFNWARLAELRLMQGDVRGAVEASRRAADLAPQLSRSQTVVGFAALARTDISDASVAFERAIELEPDNPLPRLGLGLAKIRRGRLEDGRRDLELAAALNPANSLIRGYLGKAYFDEKRDLLAGESFSMAKALGPFDPTPWFYNAISKQRLNRPVEALEDLEGSIARNDNRAVYRSPLLLGDDQAARVASVSRIYHDLGFEQLALAEASKSLEVDQRDHSAHRFLAETYSALPRHENARVSEVLQAQLLQPISLTPVPPRLAEADLFILEGAGPGQAAFNEFSSLFNRNRIAFQFSGSIGDEGILGDEAIVSGIWNRLSFSVGQFHYGADGFRPNNDQSLDLLNGFVQAQLSTSTTVQAEVRSERISSGDLFLNFDATDFSPNRRIRDGSNTQRIGFKHVFNTTSQIIASAYWRMEDLRLAETSSQAGLTAVEEKLQNAKSWTAEVRHFFRSGPWSLTNGVGRFQSRRQRDETLEFRLPAPFPSRSTSTRFRDDPRQTNAYTYSLIDLPKRVTLTLGVSADLYDRELIRRSQVNPKLGVTWRLTQSTTLRAATFRTLNRTAISAQTIEPTQVAGFSQLFADGEAEEARRHGLAIDQKIRRFLFGGIEYSWRNLRVPVEFQSPQRVEWLDRMEQLGRSYVYWAPEAHMALSLEYLFERFDRTRFSEEAFTKLRTHRIPIGIRYFAASGVTAQIKTIYVAQNGMFLTRGRPTEGEETFWVVDGAVRYLLPRRFGRLMFEVQNLFDDKFSFQDTDPSHPRIRPGRVAVFTFTVGV